MAKAKKQKNGKWRCLVYDYADSDKKKHYKSFTADTKKQAELLAAQYALTKKDNRDNDLSLAEAFDKYIKMKYNVLSPSTIRGYKTIRKNYFGDLMPYKLSKLNSNLIQASIDEMSARLTPKTVRNAHGLLHKVILTFEKNFEFDTTLPQKIKPDYIIPTTEEVKRLISNADEKIKVPIMLAAFGSLRRSEICALTVDDFDDFGVRVNKAAVLDDDNKVRIKTTKTIAGDRYVPLPADVLKEAKAWKYFGCKPYQLSGWFDKLMGNTDVPKFSFHKLRHYFASELHAQGIPDQYIKELGGWESVEMLHNIYQHTMRDKKETMTNKVLNIFNTTLSTKDNAKDNAKDKGVSV